MADTKLMALLNISPYAFRELLQLPAGAEITGITHDVRYRGGVQVRVDGAGWPTEEGMPLQMMAGTITRTFLPDGRELAPQFQWDFNKPEEGE